MIERATLVLGASGKTGRRVAERLQARNLPVRLGSRSGKPPFEWDDPATWPASVRDVAAVYVTYYPDLAAPGAPDAIRSFTELAVKMNNQMFLDLWLVGQWQNGEFYGVAPADKKGSKPAVIPKPAWK